MKKAALSEHANYVTRWEQLIFLIWNHYGIYVYMYVFKLCTACMYGMYFLYAQNVHIYSMYVSSSLSMCLSCSFQRVSNKRMYAHTVCMYSIYGLQFLQLFISCSQSFEMHFKCLTDETPESCSNNQITVRNNWAFKTDITFLWQYF